MRIMALIWGLTTANLFNKLSSDRSHKLSSARTSYRARNFIAAHSIVRHAAYELLTSEIVTFCCQNCNCATLFTDRKQISADFPDSEINDVVAI